MIIPPRQHYWTSPAGTRFEIRRNWYRGGWQVYRDGFLWSAERWSTRKNAIEHLERTVD